MGNNIPISEQVAQVLDIIKAKPILFALIAILAVSAIIFAKTEPILWRFSTPLSDTDREVETLLVANPNVDRREVFVELAPTGQLVDLGIDQSVALELDNKAARTARLHVGERNVSIVTVLRKKGQLPSESKAVPPTLQPNSSDAVMRQLAISYFVGLLLFAHSYVGYLTYAWAGLTLLNKAARISPRELKEIAYQHLANVARRSNRSAPGPS